MSVARKGGINFTVGGKTFADADSAFDRLTHQVSVISKHLGELTRPFDEIGPKLMASIRNKFNDGAFNVDESGSVITPSKFTRRIKKHTATHWNSDNRLVRTGKLMNSIRRRPGPTAKTKGVEEREVLTLRIGSVGVPYAKDQILGGVWEVPVFIGNTNKRGYQHKYIDWERATPDSPGGNAGKYGAATDRITALPRGIERVTYPGNNIFGLSDDDNNMIKTILLQYFQQAVKEASKGGGGVIPF
jgi:hypothetical protein